MRKTFTFLLCAVALQVAANSKALTAAGVKAANAAIATSEVIEANEKMVNEIYLSTVAKGIDEFTTDQINDLFNMANQCPLIGGNAVYRARAIYALIDNEQDFDDPSLCLPFGIIVRNVEQVATTGFTVMPNPAQDEVALVCAASFDGSPTVVFYDAVGHEVLRKTSSGDQQRFHLSVAALAPAVYHYKVFIPGGGIGNGKLTVLR